MHERLVIVGASGHGKVIADIAEKMKRYKETVFLDDNPNMKEVSGLPVVGTTMDIASFAEISDIFVAVGNPDVREKLLDQLWKMKANVPTLIHPQAVIGNHVTVGAGTAIMAGAVINPGTVIGNGGIINTCASVDHDCVLGDYVHIAVGAHLAGNVQIGKSTWIGAGAIVKNNINICENSMIGISAAVVKDVREPGTYIGVPARLVHTDQ